MRGVLSIYELSWEIYKKEVRLIAMISTDNGDNLLQRHIRYNGKIIGNERGRCNEGWLYYNICAKYAYMKLLKTFFYAPP